MMGREIFLSLAVVATSQSKAKAGRTGSRLRLVGCFRFEGGGARAELRRVSQRLELKVAAHAQKQ